MPKLHELLAVGGNLDTQAAKCCADLTNSFEKKKHLFSAKVVVFTPLAEGEQTVTESQSDITTTVDKELAWLQPHLASAIDTDFQIDETNTKARADVKLDDGTVLFAQVPATALMALEKRIAAVRDLAQAIPTLDPAKGFTLDTQRGCFKARDVIKTRTKKVAKPVVLYEATKEHPAQVQLATEDVPVGHLSEQEWSGEKTPAEKSTILARVDQLWRAVKSAKARANETEVDTTAKIGAKMLQFIVNGNQNK